MTSKKLREVTDEEIAVMSIVLHEKWRQIRLVD